jgi:GT2 family glycosyltransferase
MTTIIICSPDAAKFQKTAAMYARFWPPDQLQVFHIPDARSLAEAYNRGIRAAGGEVIIFSHDDLEILSPDLAQRLGAHLERFDMVGVAGTTLMGHPRWLQAGPPYIFGQVAHTIPEGYMVDIYGASRRVVGQIQGLDGLFLAIKAPVARAVMFDEQTFDGFHCYDVDFTFRAYQAGYKLAVACDIQVLHDSPGSFDETWEVHARRFIDKHASRLPPLPPKEFNWAWAKVNDKDAIREVMTPVTWEES